MTQSVVKCCDTVRRIAFLEPLIRSFERRFGHRCLDERRCSKKSITDVPSHTDWIPVQTPANLLESHVNCIVLIGELSGVSEECFDRFYRPAVIAFARFVQQLPASEAHHHAGLGGLLAHGLEVATIALKMRRSSLLPPGASAEAIAAEQDSWTYAVFAAALYHDLAKPAVDQRVTLVNSSGEAIGRWSPWTHYMDEAGAGYRIEFVENRTYRLHEQAALTLIHRILPTAGLRWLSESPLFNEWLTCLAGDHSSTIGKIIARADGHSVAKSLGAGSTRLSTAKTIPLHEKLLTSLRFLVNEGQLPLNKNGAAGWLKDGVLWLVSKRAVDAIREQLLAEGHSGIPQQNTRFFDILQEHRVLEPCGEKAIWRVRIRGEDWEHQLTVLKILAVRVWTNSDRVPDEFVGEVVPNAFSESDAGADEKQSSQKRKPKAEVMPQHQPSASMLNPIDPSKAVETVELRPTDDALRFVDWLQHGLASGTLEYNQPRAMIHRVAEGALLVTPAVFKAYHAAHPEEDWIDVQKAFVKRQWHVKNARGHNVITYSVRGKNRVSKISGILISDVQRVFTQASIPKPNPHLSLRLEGNSNETK